MRDWPLTKIVDISEHFKSISFEPGEVIYDLGSRSDAIYFVQEGQIALELLYLVQHTRTYPVSKKEVTRNTTNLIVKRTVRTLGHGR